ncbi:protein zer-1 homolog isoform X1 [Ostrinia furnacalis]|uniref:protein zer-1 homolog isoform X1 n=1 Tax=Ostrinia furnacalis TaxID=93504 RepID=UPI00103C79E8|nr:protein zer-1 homolog isoform X1 [Ostrinia furnacalis]
MPLDHDISLYDSTPDSLFDICMDFIVDNLNTMTKLDPPSRWRKLKDDVILPAEICERFLSAYQATNRVNDNIANLFRDRSSTRLQSVRLRNSRITDEGLKCLLEHKPYEVELVQCEYLAQGSLDIINSNSENLISLKFGPLTTIISHDENIYRQRGYIINAPKLRRLTIHCRNLPIFPLLLLKPLACLTHLDLSECSSLGSIWALSELNNLISLILYSVHWSKDIIDWITTLTSLRHLDISQSFERLCKYLNPNDVLSRIVTSLPHLESLDISGTNLAGSGAATVMTGSNSQQQVRCDIPGLVSRVDRPLEFLGLYGTQHGACKRHDIPAKMISGDANEEQILIAAMAYMERPAMLTHALNDLYYLFRYENNAYVGRALSVVLLAMDRHVSEKHIQISGSATLFYIVKGKERERIGIKLKRRIITALLDGMEAHLGDDTMMRNGCLTLCQFKIPTDVLFEYERVVQILLNGVSDVNQEGFVQRIAIYLLNSLACQVDGKQKRFLGNHGAISKMLNLISDRLERRVCDDVLEVAWSTMWNVTDETPQNCQRFLENRGMEYFLACLKSFPDKEELLRNMMGLLGNVAEVAELRPHLMNKLFLTVFYDLLNSSSDGIEVSYNAAGVLAHMASDGPRAWTVDEPSRDAVLARVAAAVERWDLKSERNINYRSFEPILSLLHAHHTPQCQHWAVWALANLTTVYPDKYCSLMESEGGLKLLSDLLVHPSPYKLIKDLARTVIANCAHFAARSDAGPPSPGAMDN